MYLTYLRGACLALVLGLAQAAAPYPTVPLKDLPDGLRFTFQQLKPEMNEFSHCAAAWDSQTDGDRMAFKCSIYIKMSAEGSMALTSTTVDAGGSPGKNCFLTLL